MPYEWIRPNKRSTVRHLFFEGPGQGDTSVCGIPLGGDPDSLFEMPHCHRCETVEGTL